MGRHSHPRDDERTSRRDLSRSVDRKKETSYESRRARSRAPSTPPVGHGGRCSKPDYGMRKTEKLTPIDLVRGCLPPSRREVTPHLLTMRDGLVTAGSSANFTHLPVQGRCSSCPRRFGNHSDATISVSFSPSISCRSYANVLIGYTMISSLQALLALLETECLHYVDRSCSSGYGAKMQINAAIVDIASALATDRNVLISGGSAASRTALAQFIHERSTPRNDSLIVLDCNGLPAGATADAVSSSPIGPVRRTFFIEELAELNRSAQAAVMRLVENTGTPSAPDQASDTRVISATAHTDVERFTSTAFASRLFYRLNTIHIVLREALVAAPAPGCTVH